MNGVVIIPAQSGSVAKQLCNAQFEGITPLKDKLLVLVVVIGALVVCWIVLRDQRPKRQSRASGYDGSGGADAGGEAGGHGWFGGHSHSGDHGGSGDTTSGSDAGGGGGGGDSGGGGGD